MIRIAKGSGTRPEEVNFLLEEYKKFAKMVKKMGDMKLNSKADL
jgi:signal recognition particle subunit SRP54